MVLLSPGNLKVNGNIQSGNIKSSGNIEADGYGQLVLLK